MRADRRALSRGRSHRAGQAPIRSGQASKPQRVVATVGTLLEVDLWKGGALARISHQREAVSPGHRKGGALAPPKSGASFLLFPRLPCGPSADGPRGRRGRTTTSGPCDGGAKQAAEKLVMGGGLNLTTQDRGNCPCFRLSLAIYYNFTCIGIRYEVSSYSRLARRISYAW
jgi:hypothetical protein